MSDQVDYTDLHLANAEIEILAIERNDARAEVERIRADLAAARAALQIVTKAATDYVESREEASRSIWYTDARKGRHLLELLGIEYEEKR